MVYQQHPHYMVLREVNKKQYTYLYFINNKVIFQKTDIINFANFVTSYHSKNQTNKHQMRR